MICTGGVVPHLQVRVVGRDVERTLCDEAVLPEVAQAAVRPCSLDDRPPAVRHAARRGRRDSAVLDPRHGRDAASARRPRTRRPPRIAHQRRPSAGAEASPSTHFALPLECQQRRPDRHAAHVARRAVDRIDDPLRLVAVVRRTPRPKTPSPRPEAATWARIASSAARSASETGVRSGFVSTRRSPARKRPSVIASARSASSWANRRSALTAMPRAPGPAARTTPSAPRRPTICSDAGNPSSAAPTGTASAGQPSALNGNVKLRQLGADLDLDDVDRFRDCRQRRREQQIEAVEGLLRGFAVPRALVDSVEILALRESKAAFDLAPDVLAVQLAVLGVQLTVHVGDLSHERRYDTLGQRELDLDDVTEDARGSQHAFADERVAAIRPRDAHTRVSELSDLKSRNEVSHQIDTACDVACHRARVVEARCEREDAVDRHGSKARLEPRHPAAGGRDPDRPARIRPERALDEPQRQGRRRPAARPARRPARIRRIRHDAVVQVLRRDAVGELVQVRLARVDPASPPRAG